MFHIPLMQEAVVYEHGHYSQRQGCYTYRIGVAFKYPVAQGETGSESAFPSQKKCAMACSPLAMPRQLEEKQEKD